MLCIIDIYDKYPWVISLKDKKGITINNIFQKLLDESNHKPNKIWVDKGEFCDRWMKSFLQNNDIEIHLMHNEGKSVVAERFIRTFHSTIKMIHVDLKSNTCIDSGKKNNSKDPKFN